jgi:hypothetical protein
VVKNENLYKVLSDFDLEKDVKSLWDTASKFNRGLNTPGNVQREKELRQAIENLEADLPRIPKGRGLYLLSKLRNALKSQETNP